VTPRKLWDIEHSPAVVLAGPGERTADLAASLEDETDLAVERIEDLEAVLDRLETNPAVECLWLAGEGGSDDVDLIERAVATDPHASVVYAPEAGSEALAARATAAGAQGYVTGDAVADEPVDRVHAAVEWAIERRHDAWKRSALDALVTGLDANLFAKDTDARHLIHPSDVSTKDGGSLFGRTDFEAFDTSDEMLVEAYEDDMAVIRSDESVLGKVERYPEFQDGWQMTSKVPWHEDEEVRGLVGMTLDVSRWKNRERELLQRLGHLQRIPKYLTHDLRNPLAIAQGYTELAGEGDGEALATVEDALRRLSQRLSEFHDFVDVAVEGEPSRTAVRLAPVLEDVWDHVALPGTDLAVDVPEGARIVADEDQLRPLVENLFRNAVDHAGPRVSVQVHLHEDGFSVGDDGPGLGDPAGDIFAAGTSEQSDTAGIGLAIVREVATLHGWSITTGESDLGGAQFRVRDASVVSGPIERTPTGDPVALSGSTDIGDVAVPGSATFSPEWVKLLGAGENCWGNINELHFASVQLSGDAAVTANVTAMSVAGEYSKAGAMVRSSLDPDAAYAGVCRLADRYPELLWRDEPGAFAQSSQLEGIDPAATWLRVERVDDTVCSSVSVDGEEWTPVDRRTVDLGESVQVGLFVCSTVSREPIEARFEDVEVRHLE